MLAELVLFLASCDVTGAALGSCQSPCPRSSGASYTICAEQGKNASSTKPVRPRPIAQPTPMPTLKPKPKPKELCSYYVNGTIDVPTAAIITAWVDVGSRACIGDPEPQPRETSATRTVAELVMDAFTAHATQPFAFMQPGGEIEIGQPVSFGLNVGGGEHSGELFGSLAKIRFVAVGVGWSFSDGQRLSGESVSTSFLQPEQLTAIAKVDYRIDYLRSGGSWVYGAASASLNSNQLSILVIDPPRRTLLVG